MKLKFELEMMSERSNDRRALTLMKSNIFSCCCCHFMFQQQQQEKNYKVYANITKFFFDREKSICVYIKIE
jgi:hypothetical protein